MAINAIHPLDIVNVGSDMNHVSPPADQHRTRHAITSRHHGIVAVVQTLVGESDPAAAIMAAKTDPVIGQGSELMVSRIGPLTFYGRIIPFIGGGVVVRKMTGRTARPVAGAVRPIRFDPHMAPGAELAIEFPGNIIQLNHAFDLQGVSGGVRNSLGSGSV